MSMSVDDNLIERVCRVGRSAKSSYDSLGRLLSSTPMQPAG